ncbi:MAG: RtcB family protein [Rubrobacteraceae bacterium]|nr:RtcB family protein [Rubrobacteraceae bacterium]
MAEQVSEFEWRLDGEEAEIVLYAPDDSAAERVLPAASLEGVESPVYAVHSGEGFGWVLAAHFAAPDLFSVPSCGLLLRTGVRSDSLDVPPEDLVPMILRRLSEVVPPPLNASTAGRLCEAGAAFAAEEGLIEEEDLEVFGRSGGDPDTLGRRALVAAGRDWEEPAAVDVRVVGDIFDAERAEGVGIERGEIVLVVSAGSGDLGRLAVEAHRGRILSRVRSGVFDGREDLPAAPADGEETYDLLAAVGAATAFAEGRAALRLWALRRALREDLPELVPVASWSVGGLREEEGHLVHRHHLGAADEGQVLCAGRFVTASLGAMLRSAPPFGVAEREGKWPWEEAGLVQRIADLEPTSP